MAENDEAEMSDAEFHALMRKLGRCKQRSAVRRLLSRNDVQCFTTERYVGQYVEDSGGDDFVRELLASVDGGPPRPSGETLARYHLRTCGLVREVKPDVWAPKTVAGEVGT